MAADLLRSRPADDRPAALVVPPEGPDPDHFAEIQRRADERGLPEVVYPEGWPIENYSLNPIRAAIYAKESGRVVSFTLACFRQVFAAAGT